MRSPQALVAGTNGIVGYRLVRFLHEDLGWPVVGLSRKPPPVPADFPIVEVDLTSREDCQKKLSGLAPDCLIYAARFDHPGTPSEPVDTNLAMLANLLEAIEGPAARLRHVHLVHGTKYYGAPYGRYKTPSREDDPRHLIDNFYYAQQDFITQRQKGRPWNWSISRPQAVTDPSPHVCRSLPWGIAVYAVLCRAKGIPLSFPGSEGGFRALYQLTEVDHLAKAIGWMCSEPRCGNQAFNVTNGDYIRWENVWGRIAEYFRMPVGPLRPASLGKVMAGHSAVWAAIAREHGLVNPEYPGLVDWSYLDFALAPGYDRMSDQNKIRKFGFAHCVDSEEMIFRHFDLFRSQRRIPPA